MTTAALLVFIAYCMARAASFFVCKEWRLVRLVASVSLACDLARLGMLLLPDAPVVIVADSVLCIMPSVVLAAACGGSSLCAFAVLLAPVLLTMSVDDRTKAIVLIVVGLHSYAAAAGLVSETSTLIPSWDKRACVALALCGIGAGLFSAVWAESNALSVAAYMLASVLYLVQRLRGKK